MMLWRQKLPSKDLSQRKQNMTMQKRSWILAAFHAKPCWQKKRISMNSLRRSISRSGKSAGSSSNARKSRRRQSSCNGTSTALNSSHSVCLTHGSSKARRANVCGFAGRLRIRAGLCHTNAASAHHAAQKNEGWHQASSRLANRMREMIHDSITQPSITRKIPSASVACTRYHG